MNKQVHIMRKQTRVANESLTEARKAAQAARDSADAAEKSASIAQQSYDTGLRARLTVMSRREMFMSVPPNSADHDELYLVFRNLSHRPTAILDIRVKDNGGKYLGADIIKRIKRQFILPIKIGPWDAEGRNIRVESGDAPLIGYIEIEDIDRKIFCLRPTQKWTNATEAEKCPPENH